MAEAVGFYTDTTVCIGCKACQVACHQWNDLPAGHGPAPDTTEGMRQPGHYFHSSPETGRIALPLLSGNSYDNTGSFSDVNWRHVKFIEQFSADPNRTDAAWLMMSDVCKHCVHAPCLEVCPTGAIMRTEFDTVYIQEPACNGCRDCVSACPFGVIHMSARNGVAQKCTFCYDRLQQGLPPACAQACPTQSIRFGPLNQLKKEAQVRVAQLHRQGDTRARLYGADDKVLGGLNSFYLLLDEPEVYCLPSNPKVPSRSVPGSTFWSIFTGLLVALGVLFQFRERTRPNKEEQP
ncbi:MAG TPA: 4Fe-4S dicluster domain-containing protein [Gemmataceae bacterium]|nr:4Fe-4S dicluster domain-containing protein [Gemmataceae bacterium]